MEFTHLGRSGLSVSRLWLDDNALSRMDEISTGYRTARSSVRGDSLQAAHRSTAP